MIGVFGCHVAGVFLVQGTRLNALSCDIALEFMGEAEQQRVTRCLGNVVRADEMQVFSVVVSQESPDLRVKSDIDGSGCAHRVGESFELGRQTELTCVVHDGYLALV